MTTPSSNPGTPLVSRMTLVGEYRNTLLRLQGAWDLLALLGKMSNVGAEIGQTRDGFHRLTDTLLDSLARQLLEQRLHGLRGKAQVAIDILVRNLFERTADVGFLATDAPLRAFTAAARDGAAGDAQVTELRARFAAYVAKYSVYDDIVVLATDGRVLARLDDRVAVERSQHALLAASLRGGVPYVESFGDMDLLGGRRGLVYSAAINDADGRAAGVLCLSFRFENEMRAIFGRLLGADDGSVLALLDAQGDVLTSSDRWQLPAGAALPAPAAGRPLLRFAGREYLRACASSGGYQGYAGPGWQAQALIPVDFAFGSDAQGGATPHEDHAALAGGLDTRDIFDAELRSIPRQAQQIQRGLARSVWNGKLSRHDGDAGAAAGAQAPAFGATFLQEVTRTGAQIRSVFDDAIAKLHTGVIASILDEARFRASLAIDIMDRNLYERANDCRWWALTPALREALAAPDTASLQRAGQVLQHINGLYTVYTLLVLFDAHGRVVAVSDPARSELLGQPLDADTVHATLALRDPQHYHVGPHAPSALYGDVATYVYAAAVRPPERDAAAAIGGVAIVFDGAPQFAAMLRDALPRTPEGEPLPGALGLFVTRGGSVVASTDARHAPGSAAPFAARLLDLPRGAGGQQVVEIDGTLYAAGITHGGGYREYRCEPTPSADDVAAVLLLRLGQPLARTDAAAAMFEPKVPSTATADSETREIAGFTIGDQWFGLDAAEVEAALGDLHVIGLPQAPPQVAGLLRHAGQVVPVLDMAAVLHSGSAAPQETHQLLLCRTGQGRRVALRVGTLGAVFRVGAGQLVPWPSRTGASPLRLLSGRAGDAETMMTVLSTDVLWQSVGSAGHAIALPGDETADDPETAPAALQATPAHRAGAHQGAADRQCA